MTMVLLVTAEIGCTSIFRDQNTGEILFQPANAQPEVYSEGEFEIKIGDGALANVYGDVHVIALHGSRVHAFAGARVVGEGGSEIFAERGSYLLAGNGCTCTAYDGSEIRALDGSRIHCRGGGYVVADQGAMVDEYSGAVVVDVSGRPLRTAAEFTGHMMGR